MPKLNPYWLSQMELFWGALDLAPYLYGYPSLHRNALQNLWDFEFELHRFDEWFRADLYLAYNQSIDKRGTPMFYAGSGYLFEAFSYAQSEPSIRGLLKESPNVTTIKGVLKNPQEIKLNRNVIDRILEPTRQHNRRFREQFNA